MNTWLHVLNVRRSEWKLVRTLYVFEFFQGAGMAFFFTASLALFISKFSIEELPKIFIYSSVLLWIAGYVYNKLEAKYNIISLARYITLFMALSFLAFRLPLPFMPSWFLFLMLAWFNVLYLLNNLQFWGIASQLFDVRQSKRLFGLISAGDIPAKFIGYSLALLVVSYIGTENLLWVGLACIIASFPYLNAIEKLGNLTAKHNHDQHHIKHPEKAGHNVSSIVRNFFSNVLIRRIAILTLITSSSFLIVNFSFYAKVKEAVHSDVALAQFIALFLASVRILALVLKMIFTGRLINKLGVTNSLLITPALMIILVLTILASDNVPGFHTASLYMFGAMAIVVDILRTSINAPVLLTMMQPLNTHERLRAHHITKGIMDPFASLLTGVLLLVLLSIKHDVGLSELNYILLALGVCWIIGIYRIHQQYLKALVKTIGNHFFNNPEFSVSDASTINWIKDKLVTGTASEALNILRMIAAQPGVFKNGLVLSALDHPSDEVKVEAIQIADKTSIHGSTDKLRKILDTSSNPMLKAETIKALSAADLIEREMLVFIQDDNEFIQKAALVGILKKGDNEMRHQARAYLSGMVYSDDANVRQKAVIILQEIGDKTYRGEVLHLSNDSEKEIRKGAFLAAGKMQDAPLLSQMMKHMDEYKDTVLEALYLAHEACLPLIQGFIIGRKCSPRQTETLIRLVGRIGGAKANEVLLYLMDELPEHLHSIVKTFYHTNHTVSPHSRLLFEQKVRHCLKNSSTMLYMQQLLSSQKEKYGLLINSLQIELVNLRDSLLYFFALLYDRNKIKDVRTAFESGKREAIANAMEIVEMTVKKDFANHFNLIFEAFDIDYKIFSLKKLYPSSFFENVENVLHEILLENKFHYNLWTKACSIYTCKKHQHLLNAGVIDNYVDAEHPILSETAKYAL